MKVNKNNFKAGRLLANSYPDCYTKREKSGEEMNIKSLQCHLSDIFYHVPSPV